MPQRFVSRPRSRQGRCLGACLVMLATACGGPSSTEAPDTSAPPSEETLTEAEAPITVAATTTTTTEAPGVVRDVADALVARDDLYSIQDFETAEMSDLDQGGTLPWCGLSLADLGAVSAATRVFAGEEWTMVSTVVEYESSSFGEAVQRTEDAATSCGAFSLFDRSWIPISGGGPLDAFEGRPGHFGADALSNDGTAVSAFYHFFEEPYLKGVYWLYATEGSPLGVSKVWAISEEIGEAFYQWAAPS